MVTALLPSGFTPTPQLESIAVLGSGLLALAGGEGQAARVGRSPERQQSDLHGDGPASPVDLPARSSDGVALQPRYSHVGVFAAPNRALCRLPDRLTTAGLINWLMPAAAPPVNEFETGDMKSGTRSKALTCSCSRDRKNVGLLRIVVR